MMERRDLLVVHDRHPAEDPRTTTGAGFRAVARILLRRPLATTLLVLFGLDLLFMVVEGLVRATDYGFPGAFRLSLQTEGGLPEFYGYAKSGLIAALLLGAARRWRQAPPAVWGFVFLYLAFDDALQIHERLGAGIAAALGGIGPLDNQDVGEMAVYAAVAACSLGALLLAERARSAAGPSLLTRLLLPLTVLLAFFGVGADLALSGLPGESIFEDGGELVALTLIIATTFVYTRRSQELAEGLAAKR